MIWLVSWCCRSSSQSSNFPRRTLQIEWFEPSCLRTMEYKFFAAGQRGSLPKANRLQSLPFRYPRMWMSQYHVRSTRTLHHYRHLLLTLGTVLQQAVRNKNLQPGRQTHPRAQRRLRLPLNKAPDIGPGPARGCPFARVTHPRVTSVK